MKQFISSKDNEKIKNIKKLEDKKFRNKTGLYIVEGIKIVKEAINSMKNIEFIVYNREILESINNGKEILEIIDKIEDINIIEVPKEILSYVTDTISPQGIIAVLEMEKKNILDYLSLNKQEGFLIVDRVQDAGNFGSIIRSCNAFNIKNIICIKGTVDPFMNKVVRSTMGGILRTNIFEVDESNVEDLVINLKNKEYNIITTALYDSIDLRIAISENKINEKTVFVVGNEANGVSEVFQKNSDLKVKIPMQKDAESLNVAMATSIVLYEQYLATNK